MDQPVTGRELELAQERLLNHIFPREPVSGEEKEAFERAVIAQAEWEKKLADSTGELPGRVTAVKIGNFSASVQPRTGFEMAPEARGILLRSGLLYKGVEGPGRPWAQDRIVLGKQ